MRLLEPAVTKGVVTYLVETYQGVVTLFLYKLAEVLRPGVLPSLPTEHHSLLVFFIRVRVRVPQPFRTKRKVDPSTAEIEPLIVHWRGPKLSLPNVD